MRPIRRILAAVKDPRRGITPGILKAARIARISGAKLELFHTIDDPVAVDLLKIGDRSLADFQKTEEERHLYRLESMAAQLRHRGLDVSGVVAWDYPIHEAIVRRSRVTGTDLIVAERHAHEHKAPWMLRYTDWELLRQSPVPVLLVKNSKPYRIPRVLAAIDPSHSFAKTTKLDSEILRTAASLAAPAKGNLHVLYACLPIDSGLMPIEMNAAAATRQLREPALHAAKTCLARTLRAARIGDIAPDHCHLVRGHPLDAIPAIAAQTACDIVTMGALSRSGFKRLFIGDTAERLLDDIGCDMLVVKSPGFSSHVPAKSRGPKAITPLWPCHASRKSGRKPAQNTHEARS